MRRCIIGRQVDLPASHARSWFPAPGSRGCLQDIPEQIEPGGNPATAGNFRGAIGETTPW